MGHGPRAVCLSSYGFVVWTAFGRSTRHPLELTTATLSAPRNRSTGTANAVRWAAPAWSLPWLPCCVHSGIAFTMLPMAAVVAACAPCSALQPWHGASAVRSLHCSPAQPGCLAMLSLIFVLVGQDGGWVGVTASSLACMQRQRAAASTTQPQWACRPDVGSTLAARVLEWRRRRWRHGGWRLAAVASAGGQRQAGCCRGVCGPSWFPA